MAHIQNLTFREATSNDIEAIIDIHNSNVRGQDVSNKHGFLLAKTDEEEVVENLTRQIKYFVIANYSNEILGFLTLWPNYSNEILGFLTLWRPKISNDFLNQIIWKNDAYSNKVLEDNHTHIKTVATKPDCMGKGIAQFMYKSLYEKLPNSFFTTFIVTKPIANERSIIFHEQQGFHHVGTIQREIFLDLKNYESVLMLKEL